MSQQPARPGGAPPPELPSGHATWVLGLALLLFMVIMVPLAVGSAVVQLATLPEGPVYAISESARPSTTTGTPAQRPDYVNIAVIGLDEAKRLATLRIYGHRHCTPNCPALQLELFSLGGPLADRIGLPPSVVVSIPEGSPQINITVELPVRGLPSQYPFDTYELVLGGVSRQVAADGTLAPLELSRPLSLHLQNQLTRQLMPPPSVIDPSAVHKDDDLYSVAWVRRIELVRPLYLQVLAMLLIVLIGSAATISIMVQPIQQLFIGVGGFVVGVWGVRAILVPGFPNYVTAVDLLLSAVILILLGGIVLRTVLYLRERRRQEKIQQELADPTE